MKESAVSAAGAALAEEARAAERKVLTARAAEEARAVPAAKAAEWAARGISPVRTEKPARLNERNSCP